jgi:hypothetical protein
MDKNVLAAVARWPDVPAVYGWLSLDRRGNWKLHPGGDGQNCGEGESISNTQIQEFIGRNYESDGKGRWYFQNGPQRVFVRLDAAPYVLRHGEDGIHLLTHTGQPVQAITAWWLDDAGNLYAQCDPGAAMVCDRDLTAVIAQMRALGHADLLESLAGLKPGASINIEHAVYGGVVPLMVCSRADISALLGFVCRPAAAAR